MADVLDVLIVGGGAAGYTAGLFAARDRCRALLLEKFSSGGQVLNCEHITNFPGFPQGVAGYTLGPLLQEQATTAGLQIAMNEVTGVRRDGDLLRVETDGGSHTTRALIVASGSRFTTLGVPGEKAFIGRGLSHCASCDGSFFMEKPVIVVGGGDAAVDEAIYAGLTPNTEFLGGLVPLDERGQIVTDLRMRTRVPGILAAGDVRAESARQLVTATAALAAVQYLRDGRWAA